MGATRPFRQPVKCGAKRIAREGQTAPPAAGPCPVLDGLRGLLALQVPDHVCDVGDLLLEIALVLLELAQPIFAAREASVSAEAVAAAEVWMSMHACHLLSS